MAGGYTLADIEARMRISNEVAAKPRVLFARFTLDGHDRGVITVISACRDVGMEVIYIHFTNPREIVKAAIEEDVDVIGVTSSLGEHMRVAEKLVAQIEKEGIDIPVIFGGVIPTVDIPRLQGVGVKRTFVPGSSPADAVASIRELSQH